jgi:hypothetical protein
MAPRNPSELARIEDELKYWKNNIKHHVGSRSTKEYILRQIRRCEEELGLESKDYNSNGFDQ